jgi:hypothetical protein
MASFAGAGGRGVSSGGEPRPSWGVQVTEFAALDRLRPLPHEVLRRQWVLTEDPEMLPASWSRDRLGDWFLAVHPQARVWTLRSREGRRLGWVLNALTYVGEAWTPPVTMDGPMTGTGPVAGADADGQARAVVGGEDPWVVTLDSEPTPAAIRALLYGRDAFGASNGQGFEGRWTAIVLGEHGQLPRPEVYVGATNSAVFSPSRRVVASTTNLIPGLERDLELCRTFDSFHTGHYFTFGLLPFRDAVRLLPGQCLSLDAFRVERHWPVGLLPEVPSDTGVEVLIEQGRAVIASLLPRHRSFVVPLTAGQDSRAVLAIARPVVADPAVEMAAVTSLFRARQAALRSRIDAQAARALARLAGIRHDATVVGGGQHGSRAIARNFVAIGEVKSSTVLLPVKPEPPERDALIGLNGLVGEVGRAVHWDAGEDRKTPPATITPELLVERSWSPRAPRVLEAAERWFASFPADVRASSATMLDLIAVEQRFGCWLAPEEYVPGRRGRGCSPMASTRCVETMLRLPEAYRGESRLQRDIVTRAWPELGAVPYNQGWGVWPHLLALQRRAEVQAVRLRSAVRRG